MPISQWVLLHCWWSSLIQSLTTSQTEQYWLHFWGVLSATSISYITVGCPKLKWRGFSTPPSVLFFHSPHFIFVSIQPWNVIQSAQQAIRSVWWTTFKANLETLSHPLTLCNPAPPWFPKEAGQGKGDLWFTSISWVQGSLFQCHALSFELDTDQRGVSGTLHESGMQFLDQLVSAQGGVSSRERGGLCSDRRPIHTADASGWQV